MQSYLLPLLTDISLVVLFVALPRYLRHRARSRLHRVTQLEAETFAQRLRDARLPAAWITACRDRRVASRRQQDWRFGLR